MTATTTLDVEALARAIESRDAAGQLAAYSPEAELVLIDSDNPPSRPRIVHGTDALNTYLQDVCDRDMAHEVRAVVADDERIAFEVACRYPDGTRVLCLCIADVSGGRITRQHQVQAWDS